MKFFNALSYDSMFSAEFANLDIAIDGGLCL